MNKIKACHVGVDVSKDTFNAHWQGRDEKYSNDRKGWAKLAKDLPANSVVAMEATGNYHYRLAAFLHSKNIPARVYNPMYVLRYMQSLGVKNQNDKVDAKFICFYSQMKETQIDYWQPLGPKHARARVLVSLLSGLNKLSVAAQNMRHSATLVVSSKDRFLSSMSSVSKLCKEHIKSMENELYKLVKEIYPKEFRLLKSVPGIGSKTASALLVCTNGLACQNERSLSSYVGLVPSSKQSGTSVNRKGRISKVGNPYIRALLFMGANSAVRCNRACKELYDRLIARGKASMLALVAVMHRLVKIGFGVVKSGEPCRIGKPVL